jgi:hypothetical protein
MTTKELYKKHKSGDISNQKFLYEVRRDAHLPWINNLTSYEDAVKILKNKGIINEADSKKYGDVEVISKTIDMVNPYEYSKGMNYELDMADNAVRTDLTEDEVLAAQKIVLKNITKDANYYTRLYAGQKINDTEGYKEIEIEGKKLEPNLKAEMKGRKADGYLKKEAIKSPKSNVKVDLGKKEAGTKKPKGVSEFKDKGVTGSFKTIKEGIEEIIREKLAKKKANEAKVEEAVGNFELKKLARELYSVIKKVNGVTGVKIVTSDIKNAASAFQAVSKKGNTYAEDAVMAEIFVNEANSFISIILSGTSKVLNPVANEVNKQLQAFVGKNYADQLDAQYVKAPNDNTMLGINVKFKNNPSGVKESKPVDEHHNDPDFPIVNGLYDLLDAIVADWGKEDLYQEVEDVIVAYTEPDATTISREAIKKIKDVLENYDVLEDYAELVNKIAVKEPGESPTAIDRMYNSDAFAQAQRDMNENSPKKSAIDKMKEALKSSLKKEALLVPKNTPPDQIKKYSVQGIDVKLDTK